MKTDERERHENSGDLPPGEEVYMDPLDLLVEELGFAVTDLETTGLDGPRGEGADEVVEVATALVSAPDGFEITFEREDLVNPGVCIPPQASAIHHIVDEDVEECPSFDQVWPEHADELPFLRCAHNARFDAWFLGLDPAEWVCTYRLASHLWPEAPGHGNQVLRYWLGLDVPEAKGMAAHRAMADAHVTAAILVRCLRHERVRGMTGRELLELCNAPIVQRTCRFGKHAGTPWADVPKDYLRWMERQGADAWDPDLWHTIQTHLRGSS